MPGNLAADRNSAPLIPCQFRTRATLLLRGNERNKRTKDCLRCNDAVRIFRGNEVPRVRLRAETEVMHRVICSAGAAPVRRANRGRRARGVHRETVATAPDSAASSFSLIRQNPPRTSTIKLLMHPITHATITLETSEIYCAPPPPPSFPFPTPPLQPQSHQRQQ